MVNRKITLKGTHKEIGQQVGELYKSWGKKEINIPPLVEEFYPKQVSTYTKYFPQFIEYLEGISEGLNLPKDLVLQSYLTDFLHVAYENKCSTFAIKNNNGVFIGRNYDWMESSELDSKLIEFQFLDNSSHSFIGISDMGTWQSGLKADPSKFVLSCDDAWNDKGLYISLNGAPGEKREIGMSTPHVVQLIVEQCSTTEEAIKILQEIPIPDSKLFTVADQKGNFASVEKSLEQGTRVRESTDLMITTNHFQHQDLIMENLSLFKFVPFHSTFARYHYLEYLLKREGELISIDSITELLNKPPLRQNWRGENGDVMTIWTYGLNLANMRYKLIFAPILEQREVLE